jgi:hypothetical protein
VLHLHDESAFRRFHHVYADDTACVEGADRAGQRGRPRFAGRASARLLPALGIGVSRHAMLRVLLKIPLPALTVPPVLGTDDFVERAPTVSDFI